MKRFLVVDYLGIPNGLKVYSKSKEELSEKYPNYVIKEIEDIEHLVYIEQIKGMAKMFSSQKSGEDIKELYEYYDSLGYVEFCLIKDLSDNHYYDYAEYIFVRHGRSTEPVMRTLTNPKGLYDKFMSFPSFRYELISSTRAGSKEKLNKLPELKGVKQIGSVKFLKTSNQIFVKNNDLYIKCNDFFSPMMQEKPEDIGTPLSYRLENYGMKPKNKKFIYDDNWGAIVLRRRAWIKFESFINLLDIYNDYGLARLCCSLIGEYHMFEGTLETEWINMFVSICRQVRTYVKENL